MSARRYPFHAQVSRLQIAGMVVTDVVITGQVQESQPAVLIAAPAPAEPGSGAARARKAQLYTQVVGNLLLRKQQPDKFVGS